MRCLEHRCHLPGLDFLTRGSDARVPEQMVCATVALVASREDLVTGEALWQAQEEPQIERMIMQQSGLAIKSAP